MIKRSVCIYNGKPIGIESIYTVIDGKQINIPEKLKWLSSKSKNHELFCPCGCRANLTLVAGQNLIIKKIYIAYVYLRSILCSI